MSFAGFQQSAFQNDAFQMGAFIPVLAGGGGGPGKRFKVPGEKKRKPKRPVYLVDDKIFSSAAEAAAYAARFAPVEAAPEAQQAEAAETAPAKQQTVSSTVRVDDKELSVETIVPVRATREYVADLVRAEMEKARFRLKEEAEREELKMVTMILSMMFGDDVVIEMDTAPPTVSLVS